MLLVLGQGCHNLGDQRYPNIPTMSPAQTSMQTSIHNLSYIFVVTELENLLIWYIVKVSIRYHYLPWHGQVSVIVFFLSLIIFFKNLSINSNLLGLVPLPLPLVSFPVYTTSSSYLDRLAMNIIFVSYIIHDTIQK